jgi:hypothetical protein
MFNYEDEIRLIFRYIYGLNKLEDGDKTIFPRINKLCIR